METNNKKILLVGLYYFENLGDPLYMLTTKKLLETKYNATVDIADIYGKTKLESPSEITQTNISQSFFNKVKRIKPVRALAKMYHNLTKHRKLLQMYGKMIKGYDAVVVPGGGFISFSRSYPFHDMILALEKACKNQRICFCMNAVGICRDVDRLFHEKAWRKILQSPAMTYFACRDGKKLLEQLCEREISCVSCTAVSTGDLFEISRDCTSETIGIGVIRGNAFSQYGYNLSENELISFYVDLVKKLKESGNEVKLFTNGLMSDYVIAKNVAECLKDDDILLKRPETPYELVKQISSFKAVAVARMHAGIIAYSLNIPAIMFCWGVKGVDFLKSANAMDYIISPDEMVPEQVVKKLQSAMGRGWDLDRRRVLQDSAEKSIAEMMSAICKEI